MAETARRFPIGRPPSCVCGECRKCKRAAYNREWWRKHSLEERREMIAKRDQDKVRQRDAERYYRHWEKRRAVNAAWNKAHPEKMRESNRQWAKRNPEKRRAQNLLQKAVRSGQVQKQPCEVCGSEAQGHHPDYSKPLEVVWLCSRHHGEVHRKRLVA